MVTEENRYVYPALGEEMRYILKELGVSQQELASAAGMSKSTLQKCLKGGDVRISHFIRLYKALCSLLGEAEQERLRKFLYRAVDKMN